MGKSYAHLVVVVFLGIISGVGQSLAISSAISEKEVYCYAGKKSAWGYAARFTLVDNAVKEAVLLFRNNQGEESEEFYGRKCEATVYNKDGVNDDYYCYEPLADEKGFILYFVVPPTDSGETIPHVYVEEYNITGVYPFTNFPCE